MTALKGRAIEAFVNSRDPGIHAILVYGPDAGLARERADALARSIVDDFKDPFNFIDLTDADLKTEPARLADEAAALSFAGGERVVRLRTTGEAAAKAAQLLIDGLDGGYLTANALVIIEAGELSPRSGLRKAFEKAKCAVALPCYVDGPREVRDLAIEMAASEGLTFEEDALALTTALLGDDRGVSRAELDKLILYKGMKDQRAGGDSVRLEDVKLMLVDGVGDALDEAAAAVTDGEPESLSRALHRSRAAGASAIGFLRALQRAFMRLQAAQSLIATGASPADAMKKLKPPVFFAEQRAFQTRLRRWPSPRVEAALEMLVETELAAKTTGAPQTELIERAALRLSHMAGR